MAITDKTAIEAYMLIDIDDSMDDQLAEWIAGVEAEMNKQTNRKLIASSTDAEYKYDGSGKNSLIIDDFVSITSVELDDEDITDDCYLYPANSTPKWRLESDNVFSVGRQNVVVTGKQGYVTQANLPKDLKFAATVLVTGIINYAYDSSGEVKSETIGRYSVTYLADSQQAKDFQDVKNIIKSYRRMV